MMQSADSVSLFAAQSKMCQQPSLCPDGNVGPADHSFPRAKSNNDPNAVNNDRLLRFV